MAIIPEKHKFAALSIRGSGAVLDFPENIVLSNNFIASQVLPFEVTEWWRQQLGSLACDELEKSQLYLIALLPSNTLSVLDKENYLLEKRCRNFLLGLLVACSISAEAAPYLVTGSMDSGKATFRQIGRTEHPTYIPGTKPPQIDNKTIEDAAKYASEIESIENKHGNLGRAIWALNCFLNAVTSGHVYEKIRNYIRTIEAFLLPDIGSTEKQFKSRTELFVGPREHILTGKIYNIRSNIEHLHDPLSILSGETVNQKLIGLFEMAFIAECLARYCLQRFLINPLLRYQFENDSSIKAFWKRSANEKSNLWGETCDLSIFRKSFDMQLAEASMRNS